MALSVPNSGPSLFKQGYSMASGLEEAILRNIQACGETTNLVRTSYGPLGRSKIVVNHLDKTFVTSDAATILRELEVVHPAGKVLVFATQQQENEIGNGTNLVLMLAGELLKNAESLLVLGLHPSEIIQGYSMALDKAEEILPKLESGLASHDEKGLATALTTALASKQYGAHEQLAKLVAKAAQVVMPSNPALFNVDAIRVVKVLGSSLNNSSVIKGMVFPRAPESTTKSATKAKVAIFSSGIDVAHTETKGTVLLKNADELLGFSKGEEEHLEKIINEIAATGVKCIIAGNQVGELALHYLNRHGIVVLKVLSKFDLRRLANVVGATPLTRMGPPMPEEMGFVDVVESVEIGGDRVTVLRQDDEATKTATIVVRGATTSQMDDIERAIDDGVNSIKALLRDPRFVPGAGATELEIAKQVAEYGEKTPGLSQHGIRKFAESLEVVPRTLAENAGLDATEVLANLYAAHQSGDKAAGVDIDSENSNGVLNAQKHGILDLMVVTEWAMRYATQAALTVLQVDAIIMSKASGIAGPKQNPNWDED